MKKSRVAKNTLLLYMRMIIVMIINLYTVRLVYQALGEEDYGIFNVIAGVVIMFQSISSVLSTSTQRFYSYYIGKKEESVLWKVFSASVNIFLIYAIIILILAETLGLWFINTYLNIPSTKMYEANWLYQLSILAFILTIIQSPYSSAVIAYEHMDIFAIISFTECILKFIAIIIISNISDNRLILYGAALTIVPFLSLTAYHYICHKKYKSCSYIRNITNRKLYKELLSFSGWHLFSSAASVGMNQINTILVNIFFGLITNAARGIALQLNSALASFSGSFIMAIRPPLIKLYAEGDFDGLNKMFNYSNKFIYYLMLIIVIPLYFGMETILRAWIGTINYETVLFCRLCLIYSLILSLNNPISIIVQATGKIKDYFIYVEIFTILCPIATYFLFKAGFPASSTFYAMIIAIILSHIVRIKCLKNVFPLFKLREYIVSFMVRALISTIMTVIIIIALNLYISSNFWIISSASVLTTTSLAFLIGFNYNEKRYVTSTVKKVISKIL